MSDEHSLGLTDPRIIQILNQTKEGRAKLQSWQAREAAAKEAPQSQQNAAPALSLKNFITALVFSMVIAALLTLLMIGIVEVVRWIF